jgi:hypothetical protein
MDHGLADEDATLVAGECSFVERVDDWVGEQRVAAKPTRTPTKALPPSAAALRETKIEATTTRTTIAVA